MRHDFLIIFCCLCWSPLVGQDTIQVDPISFYSSSDWPVLGKTFYSQVRYAREEIVYSNEKMRVDYCYYYDSERECFGRDYHLLNDSILMEDSVRWEYIKLSENEFQVSRKLNGGVEIGRVRELFPLEKKGVFYVLSSITGDTIWQEDYSVVDPRRSYSRDPAFCYYYSEIEGPVYNYDEIDVSPRVGRAQWLDTIDINIGGFECYGQPLGIDVTLMICVITKDGRIVNIEQGLGGLSVGCPGALKEIILEISNWESIAPGRKDGIPVNVLCFVAVNNLDLSSTHPIYEDTRGNRKRILKLKRKGKLNGCQQKL